MKKIVLKNGYSLATTAPWAAINLTFGGHIASYDVEEVEDEDLYPQWEEGEFLLPVLTECGCEFEDGEERVIPLSPEKFEGEWRALGVSKEVEVRGFKPHSALRWFYRFVKGDLDELSKYESFWVDDPASGEVNYLLERRWTPEEWGLFVAMLDWGFKP